MTGAPPVRDNHVFINCPFDDKYKPIFNGLVFAVHDAAFVPRCALEIDDASQVRLQKTVNIIAECRFGIHDISRTELDRRTRLPRFNMPFELGVFLGCKFYGGDPQQRKSCLILDADSHRYQAFLSDIAGQDIKAHGRKVAKAIKHVRDWLRTASGRENIPAAKLIVARFGLFRRDLPRICKQLNYAAEELTFTDLVAAISHWLEKNPISLPSSL